MPFPHISISPVRRQDPEALRVQRHDGQAIRALYAQAPKIECKGLCWDSCSTFDITPWERHMATRAGVTLLPTLPSLGVEEGKFLLVACSALDPETKRCRIYAARPMVCRLWGTFKALQCPYGCIPEGGLIEDPEAIRLLALSLWYGGTPGAPSPEEVEEFMRHPDLVERTLSQYPKPVANAPIFIPSDQIEWVREEGSEG